MLEKIFPIKIFYRWKGDVAEDFNPVLTQIDEGGNDSHSYKPFLKWIVEDGGKIRTIQRSDKTVGIFKKYEIRYNLPNFIEDDFRKENGGGYDMMDIEIFVFNECVAYDIGIWKIKKKTGEKEIENKNIYHMGKLDTDTYFTDYLQWSYDKE